MLQELSCSSYMIKLHPWIHSSMNPRSDVMNHSYKISSVAILRPDFILRDQDRKWKIQHFQRGSVLRPAPGRCSAPNVPGRGGEVFEHPSPVNSAPGLCYIATCGKRHSKERKKSWRNCFGHFLGQVKNQVTRGHQRSNFVISAFFYKSAHNSGTRRATAPGKSAFDSSINVLSLTCPQISSKINGLASREQKLQNRSFCEKGSYVYVWLRDTTSLLAALCFSSQGLVELYIIWP